MIHRAHMTVLSGLTALSIAVLGVYANPIAPRVQAADQPLPLAITHEPWDFYVGPVTQNADGCTWGGQLRQSAQSDLRNDHIDSGKC